MVIMTRATSPVLEVSVAEAKSRLSDLLGRVAYGDTRIVITKRGRPVAELVSPREPAKAPRALLDHDDPYFAIVDEIVASRSEHRPRVGASRVPAKRRRP